MYVLKITLHKTINAQYNTKIEPCTYGAHSDTTVLSCIFQHTSVDVEYGCPLRSVLSPGVTDGESTTPA